jgi:hypothetical protein
MKEILISSILTVLTCLIFISILVAWLGKNTKNLKWALIASFMAFLGVFVWTLHSAGAKAIAKIAQMSKPRTGEEIYAALFDKPSYDCVKVLDFKDQIVPKIDVAIFLHFETCPNELKRILARHEFASGTGPTKSWTAKIPYAEEISWFTPQAKGDTIMVYEFSTNHNKNIQTIWASKDSTKVFCRDIAD